MYVKSQAFFDRKTFGRKVDAMEKRALSRFGFQTRKRARGKIKVRRGKHRQPSLPGQPPFARRLPGIKKIAYAYDPVAASVVIGPMRLGGSKSNVPALLEHGGFADLPTYTGSSILGFTQYRLEPRPFMSPAFHEEVDGAAELFRGEFK